MTEDRFDLPPSLGLDSDDNLPSTESTLPPAPEPAAAAKPATPTRTPKPKPTGPTHTASVAAVEVTSGELQARATLFRGLLERLGASLEQPPESSSTRRSAAEAEARTRLSALGGAIPGLDLDAESQALIAELFDQGPLRELLGDPSIRTITIRGPRAISVDRGAGHERIPGGFSSAEAISLTLRRLVGPTLRWDARSPWLDERLADGSRVRAAHASVSPGGPVVVIQRPRAVVGTGLEGAVEAGLLPQPIAELVSAALRARGSLMVCLGDGVDGGAITSAIVHELARVGDPSGLALVRAGAAVPAPAGALVFDTELGLASAPISMAVAAGARRLVVDHAWGAGLASGLGVRSRGVDQVVLTLDAADPSVAMQSCVDGLILAGYGRDRQALCRSVAAAVDLVLVMAADPSAKAGEALVAVADYDAAGVARTVLSRSVQHRSWQQKGELLFVAEMARRGVPFDPARFASLA